jgi:hypothetical protein
MPFRTSVYARKGPYGLRNTSQKQELSAAPMYPSFKEEMYIYIYSMHHGYNSLQRIKLKRGKKKI